MADIELVIKIPEELYINGQLDKFFGCSSKKLDEVIYAGTPLPKGHGRLIDVNDLLDDINLEDNDYNRDTNTGEIITLENIDRIPTIIEADVGGVELREVWRESEVQDADRD